MDFVDVLKFIFIQNFNTTIPALITAIVGYSAYRIYFLQKGDRKRNIARLILSEIRDAEEKIQEINEIIETKHKDFPSVLPVNSWREYSYLFASDFDQDELSEMNLFYSLCRDIDEYASKDNDYFWVTTKYRAKIAQEMLARLVGDAYDKQLKRVDDKQLQELIEQKLYVFANHPYFYSPSKTVNNLKLLLTQFNKISTTTTDSKLKRIARIK